ncbi:ATP-binding protein [Aeromonas hydrophila]|uniref:AAA family ATPase n=1 Tax=Aeromonas hydrophila TaxID=644 RepID=UPI002379BD30|nr:ATP-binding protein [Aeromonas hydrophila]MDD9230203.1 ATP-binding protein [Aeromonas hydrophila]
MSIAGIRSNRGDGYQTLVALDWALTVLSEPNHQWLEMDSITYSVDDVVIGKADGTQIACQCKKNQPNFKSWSIADLSDELIKASHLLAAKKNVEVRFYSRNNFGDLAKLREHSSTQPDETSYKTSLGIEQIKIDSELSALLTSCAPSLSSYEFLHRTKFEISPELERMEELQRERLLNMVSNPDAAFDALWVRLDKLGARIGGGSGISAPQHRLTKDDLKAILSMAGAMLAPPINLTEVRLSFSDTSAIGRSWRRDIGGKRIPSPAVNALLAAIDARKRAILLTGLPGSGKTCVMLALQDELELRSHTRSDIVSLFIQSREFADLITSEDRRAQGLSEQWVEKAARLAEGAYVVVVIDSLDVLSIAREHQVLTYFLAQIDRLLSVPNITIVTACRDFDRHYDRRIAERRWDCELKCEPLVWDTDIAPLLDTLGIATGAIDVVTRELIRNPRELALFVELAQRDGSFNVVTGQALAQRYLDTMVLANGVLGDVAIKAIEDMASEMLKLRSLTVPRQRFSASQLILRELCSLNVLQETQEGKLTFGHQTLLDTLVISGALRNGVNLNEFIQELPPVPFVRPSIRSFVSQLALGERREFRKQIRTVLTGRTAFHIKRLVAESFAEQIPHDDDWFFIRELRENQRDVFQVIYNLAKSIEWHYFWLNNLTPSLKVMRDADGLTAHAYRIAQWINEDCAGVLSYWMEILSFEWLDNERISERLEFYISDINTENIKLVAPLLQRLLDTPRSEHSLLGKVIARCVTSGVVDDNLLWNYIAGEVNDEDLLEYQFDNKLRCNPHELGGGNESFLCQRMEKSSQLLDLAIDKIEQWSTIRSSRYSETRIGYRHGFLSKTSYEDTHSQRDIRHEDNMDFLFDAVEKAILHHANSNSSWWMKNRNRLCFNEEGSLLYFAILACTASPDANLDLIGRMLCDKKMLEFELTYELGSLLQTAFTLLAHPIQDAVIANIMTVWNSASVDENNPSWVMKARSELIVPIPCCQRSLEMQTVLDAYEKSEGVLIRQPDIYSWGGIVSAPFSFDVFLSISDVGVLRLLDHYNGHQDSHGHDFLLGGEREVGFQLREAASRHPARFLRLLSIYWANIPTRFRDDLMEGVATYLAYRYGNLRTHNQWQSIEEPDASLLVSQILNEFERHPAYWRHRSSTAKALEACANVIQEAQEAERLIFLAIGFVGLHESDPIEGDNVSLLDIGINMAKGDVAEALMILAKNFLEHGKALPELLSPTLRRFAGDEHPAIRAMVLLHLPYVQSKSFDLGWELFHIAMQDAVGLWKIAEPCLYYAYYNHFDIVRPLLEHLRHKGSGKDLKTWGRISALSAMAQRIDFANFLDELDKLNSTEAWLGAVAVWTNIENARKHREQCLAGLSAGLGTDHSHARAVAGKVGNILCEKTDVIFVPTELIRRCFSVFNNDGERQPHGLFGFHEWLNAISQHDPEQALAAIEIYLTYVSQSRPHLYDHENSLTQLMTRLFAEAEEREESDDGSMLQRVVIVQDTLLSLGLNGLADWLKAAERP